MNPFTYDDLIDLHYLLEDDRLFVELLTGTPVGGTVRPSLAPQQPAAKSQPSWQGTRDASR